MIRSTFMAGLFFTVMLSLAAQQTDTIPVRGLCIAAPAKNQLDRFITFVDEELSARRVNTLVLRVDYNYAYLSHPELRDENPLSKEEVGRLVEICRKHQINLIPQVNLLGHQSWASDIGNLLEVYPQFDETPNVKIPEEYKWPNDDGLYCKSYCPLHPEVHAIVFDLVDEIVDVFEASAFHAGMDEVFYIGDEQCPRCQGRDKAELFAGEVSKISNHLTDMGKELWIWGDRLIDGKTTGIGMWEASMNSTHRAIDLIPKEVVINDWHYERPDPTAHYFALKGFKVITCPWRNLDVTLQQLEDFRRFKRNSTEVMAARYLGLMETYWSGAESFLDIYYETANASDNDRSVSAVACFKALFPKE